MVYASEKGGAAVTTQTMGGGVVRKRRVAPSRRVMEIFRPNTGAAGNMRLNDLKAKYHSSTGKAVAADWQEIYSTSATTCMHGRGCKRNSCDVGMRLVNHHIVCGAVLPHFKRIEAALKKVNSGSERSKKIQIVRAAFEGEGEGKDSDEEGPEERIIGIKLPRSEYDLDLMLGCVQDQINSDEARGAMQQQAAVAGRARAAIALAANGNASGAFFGVGSRSMYSYMESNRRF